MPDGLVTHDTHPFKNILSAYTTDAISSFRLGDSCVVSGDRTKVLVDQLFDEDHRPSIRFFAAYVLALEMTRLRSQKSIKAELHFPHPAAPNIDRSVHKRQVLVDHLFAAVDVKEAFARSWTRQNRLLWDLQPSVASVNKYVKSF